MQDNATIYAQVQSQIENEFSATVNNFSVAHDILSFSVAKENLLSVINFLKDECDYKFDFLIDLCGVHFPDENKFAVVYHLQNLQHKLRLRIKTFVAVDKPEVDTLTNVYAAANWMERETYDFFGIKFLAHPNLKRILNVEEMNYHPMRKEFPLEDQTRRDKDDEMFGRNNNNLN